MSCSEVQIHLEAYALGSLDSYTRARVEEHLRTCSECRGALARYQHIVGELPQTFRNVSALRPPPSLKNKIMHAAQADQQARAIQETFAPRAGTDLALANRRRWLLNPRIWALSLTLGACLIALLVGTWFITQEQMNQALVREQAALTQLDSLQHNQQELYRLASSQTRHELVLDAVNSDSGSYGKVLLEPNKPTVLFTAHHLPQLNLGERYFLWTVNRGAIHLVGVFSPNSEGFAMVMFMADREDPVLKQVFVTRQLSSRLLPSNEHFLEWRASPNDSAQEYTNPYTPFPTVVYPTR